MGYGCQSTARGGELHSAPRLRQEPPHTPRRQRPHPLAQLRLGALPGVQNRGPPAAGALDAPAPVSQDLKLLEVPPSLVAVGSSRGFDSDRGRTEEGLAEQRQFLADQVRKHGFRVCETGNAFTLANYADGYEMWLSVEPSSPVE